MFAIELTNTASGPLWAGERVDRGIPECIEHLSPRNPGNLIHREHVQLCVPSSERIDDRLVLYGIEERNESAPLAQAVDLGPEYWWANFEQDVRGCVDFFLGHYSGTGGFVVFIGELRGSPSVPFHKDLGHPLLEKQRGVLWRESGSALIWKSF